MGTVRGGLRFSGRKHRADGFGGRQQSGVHGQRAVTRLNRIGDTDETHTPDLRANGFCWWPHGEPVLCSLLTRGLLAVVECHWLRRGIDLHHAGLSFRDTGPESNVSAASQQSFQPAANAPKSYPWILLSQFLIILVVCIALQW